MPILTFHLTEYFGFADQKLLLLLQEYERNQVSLLKFQYVAFFSSFFPSSFKVQLYDAFAGGDFSSADHFCGALQLWSTIRPEKAWELLCGSRRARTMCWPC